MACHDTSIATNIVTTTVAAMRRLKSISRAAVKQVMTQLREQLPQEQEQRIAVFDSGGYSEANMKSYN
jgi:predicted nucleic acid-binding protein